MDEGRLRQLAMNIHRELMHHDAMLKELNHLQSVRDALESMPSEPGARSDDLAIVKQKISDVEDRQRFHHSSFESKRERLLPIFRRLAEKSFDELNTETDVPIEMSFREVLEPLVSHYAARVANRTTRSNEIVRDLLILSQGLAATDTEQETLPYPAVIKRFGPTEDGRYTGIRVAGREAHLARVKDEVEQFIASAQAMLQRLGKALLDKVDLEAEADAGIGLKPTGFFGPETDWE